MLYLSATSVLQSIFFFLSSLAGSSRNLPLSHSWRRSSMADGAIELRFFWWAHSFCLPPPPLCHSSSLLKTILNACPSAFCSGSYSTQYRVCHRNICLLITDKAINPLEKGKTRPWGRIKSIVSRQEFTASNQKVWACRPWFVCAYLCCEHIAHITPP